MIKYYVYKQHIEDGNYSVPTFLAAIDKDHFQDVRALRQREEEDYLTHVRWVKAENQAAAEAYLTRYL